MTFSEVTSVWGVSAVAILDCSLNVYACVQQKALTMPAYCIAANCNNLHATQGKNGSDLYNSNDLTLMLCLSHAHLCSEHFAECNFVLLMAEYQMVFASKWNL